MTSHSRDPWSISHVSKDNKYFLWGFYFLMFVGVMGTFAAMIYLLTQHDETKKKVTENNDKLDTVIANQNKLMKFL